MSLSPEILALWTTPSSNTAKMADLEDLIRAARKAVDAAPGDHPDRARQLSKLAFHLHNRYSRAGELDDLEDAIRTGRAALNGTPQDDPTRLQRLINLCVYVGNKFKSTDAAADLEEAIKTTQEAVISIPPDYPNRATLLNKLALLLGVRYSKTSSITDIEEAIRIQREVLDTGSQDHPNRLVWISNLGGFLNGRYERTGAIVDIDEATQICRSVVDIVPAESPVRLVYLNNLGSILSERYLRVGKMADLDEAIRIAKEVIASLSNDHPDRFRMMNNYGNLLGDRYLRTGAMTDLEEVLQVGEQVLDLLPSDSPERAICLSNFAIQLSRRYERMGTIADLDRAIRIGKEAVEISPEGQRANCLNNLGILLKDQYLVTAALGDLEYAIRMQQQAVNAIPKDHPDVVVYLHNLGGLLRTRFLTTRATTDLEEAHRIGRQVVDICPKDHLNRAAYLNTLGVLLGDLFAKKGAIADLEEAVQVAQEAADATGEDHPQRATRLTNLGDRLGDRFTRTGAMADLEQAIACHQSALRHLPSSTMTRITAGRGVLKCCAAVSDWQQAYEAAEVAVQLVPKLTPRSLENRDKQDTLSQVTGLASDAAAVALNAGKGALAALRFLEQGRGLLAMSLEEMQTDVPDLKERHPELADRFIRLRDELEAPRTGAAGESHLQAQASRRSTTSDELDELIIKIREQPGCKDFLLAPSELEFRKAAVYGPIIMINVSEYRCDAVLVEQHRIWPLALPSLSIRDLREKSQEEDLGSRKVLEWLWDAVTGPILSALGVTGPPLADDDLPHLWWIPTGVLSVMPLHAAGHHCQGSTETVLDRAMSSYSSSIRAIIHGRQRHAGLESAPSVREKALLVAMEHTPGESRLRYATEEISMLRGLCKSMEFDPIEPERRKQHVMSHLPQCKIFHFAGHGYTDEYDPSKSCLLLDDWRADPLTLATLQATNMREHAPFLAYLSACGTGQVRHERFLDESLHLVSGYQVAGFRHVVGTLWQVNDEPCMDIARITYEGIRRGDLADESVCRGLHKATRELRDRWLSRPSCVREEKRQVRKVYEDRGRDEIEAWGASDGGQGHARLPRDIIPDDDDEDDRDIGPLHWVPYVHYGV
jgi:tetratricopeptide (TPR) repeat protein